MQLSKFRKAQLRWAKDPKAKAQGGFWITLIIYVVLFVLSELLRPKPDIEDAKPAGLGDFQFPTATEDRVVPLLWGTIQIRGPNVVWYGDLIQEAITEKVKTGLFSSETVVKGFRYNVGIQFAFCRGPVDSLLRIWIGDDIVYDAVNGGDAVVTHLDTFTINEPDLFGGDDLGNGGVVGTMRFFEGNETQAPSSYLDDFQVEGNRTPAYRGTCYIAPSADPVYVGNSTSIKPWKFEMRRIPDGLGLGASASLNNGNDANPANVIYEIFTNTEWGLGQPASAINTSPTGRGFVAAGNTLFSEGNGFSYLMDRQMEAIQLLELLEQQIGGKVYFNKVTGQWEIGLARDDYDINTVPEVTEANAVEIKDFTRGSWDDTTNIVRSKYNDRENEYQGTFGLAQDSANIRLQDGVNVSTTVNFPGCKDAALANQLAWRTLRTLSYPLAKATFIMDRDFYDTNPVDVLAFSSTKFGLDKLPMRVTRVDIGDLENNRVTIDVVQDVFFFQVGSFGDPGGTGWEPPADTLLPFLPAEQVAFEAPRAFVSRNPTTTGFPALFWAGARRRGPEVGFKIFERNSSGTPAGSFAETAESYQFLLIGQLLNNLDAGATSAVPTPAITITNTPDSQADLIAKFDEAKVSDGGNPPTFNPPTVEDLGENLVNLVYVTDGVGDGEFMLVQQAIANGGANVDMQSVYRGVLDTVQSSWPAGSDVFLVFSGGNVSQTGIPETNNVHVKLLPFSLSDQLDEASATQIVLSMDRRNRRPYPPSRVTIGTTAWGSTVSLEQQNPGGLDNIHFDTSWIRRDYRTGNGLDEIPPLTVDAATLDASFPAANNTTHDMEVRNDPDGLNTLLFTDSGLTGASNDINRTEILHALGGTLPTRMRVVIDAVHDEGGDVGLTSRQSLIHDFDVTTSLTGQFQLGDLDTNVDSNVYTVDAAGVHNFTMGTATPTNGDVRYRVNGGSWLVLIPQGSTSGATTSLSISDTLEIEHTSTDAGFLTFIGMTAPGGGTDAWGILFV